MNDRPAVLLVEDEPDIVELLDFTLSSEGFIVSAAADLRQAQEELNRRLPDVLILDRMLPDGDGLSWLRQLRRRERTENLPVLILTARAAESDKLDGLNGGSDDYITKPFSPKELVARVRTVLRRAAPHHVAETLSFADCELITENRSLKNAERTEVLSVSEFQLLKFFLTHKEKTYSRSQLLDLVWGDHVFIEERTVDVHVLRLRKMLQKFHVGGYLQTVRGLGYRWSEPTK